jgi:hypothetical protein
MKRGKIKLASFLTIVLLIFSTLTITVSAEDDGTIAVGKILNSAGNAIKNNVEEFSGGITSYQIFDVSKSIKEPTKVDQGGLLSDIISSLLGLFGFN